MQCKILTSGQIDEVLKFSSATDIQLTEMRFGSLESQSIYEALPPE